MSAWPLMAASGYLLIDYLLPTWNQDTVVLEVDNSHYLWYSDEVWSKPDKWKLYSAIMLSCCASLLSSYSAYAAEEDYYNAADPGYGGRYGQKLELAELLAVPWRCENVFNFDVFPAFPMFVLLSVDPMDFYSFTDFFRRESVPFLGMEVLPTAGFAMTLNYLICPDYSLYFSLGASLSY